MKTKLPPVVCRCHDDGCGLRERCLRWLARNDEGVDRWNNLPSLKPYDEPLDAPCPFFMPEGEQP